MSCRTRSVVEIAYLAVQLFSASVPHPAIEYHTVISPDEIFVLAHCRLANVLREVDCAWIESDHRAWQYLYNRQVSALQSNVQIRSLTALDVDTIASGGVVNDTLFDHETKAVGV